MSEQLLLLSIGPVQDFIAQARRTRDLWYGSHLLSELARAAARALLEEGAQLIFPPLERNDAELSPCPSPLRPGTDQPPLAIGNKLLALVPAGAEPSAVARRARAALREFWSNDIAEGVLARCKDLIAEGSRAAWDEQVESLLEVNAAWLPLAERGYSQAREDVEAALAERKNLRDFSPWRALRGDVPKSSLDGARETVLRRPEARGRLAIRYRINRGEQLDAVGLIKRAGGEPEQFAPIANIAFACWLEQAQHRARPELQALQQACRELQVQGVSRNLPCARALPFDAQILMPSRWASLFEEQGLGGERPRSDAEAWGRAHVVPLLRRLRGDGLGDPYPYVACLVADGDRLGKAISSLDTPEAHRALSQALTRFAERCREIVEQQGLGSLVYAGGDDVLAFVPLPRALACAEALRVTFAQLLEGPCSGVSELPTLSVGIGVGHLLESMGDLLALGREAERLAKRERNALGVVVDKRSGGKRTWVAQWSTGESSPAWRLEADVALLAGALSAKKVHEIQSILERLPQPEIAVEPEWARVLELEVRHALSRTHASGPEARLSAEAVSLDVSSATDYSARRQAVQTWVDRLLIARVFASASVGSVASRREAA